MKTIILLACNLLFAFSSYAQIILNTGDLPAPGDLQVSVKVDSTQAATLLTGSSGANVVWDFSNLRPCCNTVQNSYDSLAWILPASTSYYANFPLSNLAYKKDCYKVHSHATHTDKEFCNYTYCIKNNNGVKIYGYYKNEVRKYDKMRFVFPLMKYGDTIREEARLIYYNNTDTIKVRFIKSTSVADGWGTLITPINTSPALRVQTYELIYDSIYIKGTGNLQSTTDSNYYYHWYTKNLGFPVLQIFKSALHQENLYFQNAYYAAFKTIILNTPELNLSTTIQVLNEWPGRNVSFVFSEDISDKNYFIEWYDISGRKINPELGLFSDKITASFDNYSSGIYIYRIGSSSKNLKIGKIAVE